MPETSLEEHYKQMWSHAQQHILDKGAKADLQIDDAHDKRYGITLLLRPPQTVAQQIEAFLSQMQGLEPDQYYYPVSDLHLTVLSIISCYSGFSLDQININDYDQKIEDVLLGLPPLELSFRGITASPATILLQGFPHNEALQMLRDRLRSSFKSSNLQHSIDSRYHIFTAHSTIIRFRKAFKRPSRFIEQLEKYRDYPFGTFTAQELELVANDWYQRQGKVRLLKTYSLT
ncbi:mutarotase [Porifericola rhodea]|uniref:2'-5' RNA ligase family protein n=1 Tax=Porifericola rhodea TaxID=930972 RepID=UPI00266651D3|nr:2'-5' RNA ligase family protein [Porifericola rhodea]WKN32247.1 mutarotase [Porifericola rhodea]